MRRLILAVALILQPLAAAFALQGAPNGARDAAIALGQPLTPQMFGAFGNGRGDDTAALAAWLGSNKPLFCSGTFRVTRAIAVDLRADGGLFLQGAGRQLCKIVLAAPEAGITIRGGTPDIYDTPQVVLHDLSLAPAAVLTGPALTVAYSGGSGATDPTLDLRDVAVKPVAQIFYAPVCIRLDNVRNGVAEMINCEGHRGRYEPGSRGIVITGEGRPVEMTLRDIDTYFMEQGIAVEGNWQGVAISEAVCVVCRVGVRATATDNNGAWLRVLDSHFHVEDIGVETINIVNVNVFGSYVFLNDKAGFSTSPYRACISETMLSPATMWAKISGTTCDASQPNASPKYGVYIDDARRPASFLMEDRIEGNTFFKVDWGIYLAKAAAVAIGSNTYAFVTKGNVWNGPGGDGVFANTQAPKDEPLRAGGN